MTCSGGGGSGKGAPRRARRGGARGAQAAGGAGVRRRRLRASRGGMTGSGRRRRSSARGLDDHGDARASERRGRERARCRGRFDHESNLAVREASRRISGPNSALLVLIILLSSQLILIKVVNTRVLHTRSSSSRTRCGPTSGRTTTWRPWSPSRAGRGVSVSGNCSADMRKACLNGH